MKGKLLLLILIVPFLFYSQAFGQNYRNAITLNPIGIFLGAINAQYENAISGENSFTVRANLISRSISSYGVSAFGVGGSYRWYLPPNRAIVGIWVGPAIDLMFVKWKHPRGDVSQTVVNISGEIGYKWIFEQYVVEPFFSLGFGIGKVEAKNGNVLDYGNGIMYGIGINLGYSW